MIELELELLDELDTLTTDELLGDLLLEELITADDELELLLDDDVVVVLDELEITPPAGTSSHCALCHAS